MRNALKLLDEDDAVERCSLCPLFSSTREEDIIASLVRLCFLGLNTVSALITAVITQSHEGACST